MAVTSLADRNSIGIRTEEVENIDDGAQAEQIPVKDKLVGEVNRLDIMEPSTDAQRAHPHPKRIF